MAELKTAEKQRVRHVRHRGRGSQVLIYLGKQLRFFINQSDWKMLPMAAVIAALVSMVIRRDFFTTMEGNLKGAFALTCVAIWNGCFNSIQSICRERPIIKREHRSGLHISSYVAAHMLYQLGLCAVQTLLSIYVMVILEVKFPVPGFMTGAMQFDIAITMLLISYAADMLSLFISSVAHTTTGAMTVMPFVLIFQLVFSGGLIPLPVWAKPLSNYTISNYGIKAIASQSGYNEVPMVTGWNTLNAMRTNEIGGTITLGQLLDALDSPVLENHRDAVVVKSITVGEAAEILNGADEALGLREREVTHPITVRRLLEIIRDSELLQPLRAYELVPASGDTAPLTVGDLAVHLLDDGEMAETLDREIGATVTLGQILDALHAEEAVAGMQDVQLNEEVTLGQIVDFLRNNEALQSYRDRTFTFRMTIEDAFDFFGEENVKSFVQEKTAAASQNPAYERSVANIVDNWLMLGVFALLFAALSVISLELIDRDKR